MSAGGLRCRVLGTPRVEVGGVEVSLGSPLALQAWCQLVAARGRRVSDQQLVDALWPDDPPATAISTLRVYVSRLRKALDPDGTGVVVRELGGYRTPAEVLTTDADDFEQACAWALSAADPDQRSTGLEEAIGRWAGGPYEGLPDLGWVADERARLLDARAAADHARLEALVDAGATIDVLPALERRVAERPSDERAHELLALALYRSGRQVDALEALRSAREGLLEGWGLDPGPSLTRLETQMLRQDPALDRSPARAGAASTVVLEAADASDAAGGEGTRPTSSVPLPLSSFVGRVAELDQVRSLLDRERVVNIVAVGGTGKTRLALETARWVVAEDGPWFVDLGELHDADLLGETVATAVGLLPGAGADGLVLALARRTTLLVLDNCEHLAPAVAALVTRLLETCPGLQVLATSRVALGVEGEHVVALAPLDPDGDAVELFRHRASAAGAAPDDLADTAAVAALCRRVDGHPLAVELIARQCRLLTLEQLAEHLDDRAELLGQERPPQRAGEGRTLAQVIAWSVDRLDDAGRERFWRLAVFDGGFDLSAARAVCEGPGLVSGLMGLLDAGLLQVSDGPVGRRWRMLETLRTYAAEAAPGGVVAEAARAHRRWVGDLARAAGAELRGPASRAWSDRLEVELPNIRTALASALADGDGVTARVITGEVGWFWFRRAHVAEGLRWCHQSLALPHPGTGDAPGGDAEELLDEQVADDARATARTYLAAGLLSYLAGLFEQLGGFGAEAVTWGERSGDVQSVVASMGYQAYLLAYAGLLDEARALSAEAERRGRGEAPPWTVAEVLMLRGQLHRALGDPAAALAILEESADLARRAGHDWCEGSALWNAGKSAWDTGDLPAVTAYAASSVRVQHAAGDLTSWLVSLHMLAGVAALRGQGRTAGELMGVVAAYGERLGFSPEVMDPLDSPRHVAAAEGALTPPELAAALVDGGELDPAGVMERVEALARLE